MESNDEGGIISTVATGIVVVILILVFLIVILPALLKLHV